MSRVEDLFQRYVKVHAEGDDADPREFLREVKGGERDELAALIDHYLAGAPSKAFDPDEFDRFRSDPRRQALAERILGPTLEELRAGAELSRREVAKALTRDLDLAGHEDAVKARYHELETGQLDPRRIAAGVWASLARMFGESVERLEEIVESTRESGDGEPVSAFARSHLRIAAASLGTRALARRESEGDDLVDAAFFSH